MKYFLNLNIRLMQKILMIVILVITFNPTYSQDTLSLNSLQNQLSELQVQNESLKYKVTVLNDANTKFLTVTYATIGFCLMLILALSIWNGYINVRIDKKRFENFEKGFRIEIHKNIIDDIDGQIKSKTNSQLLKLSNEVILLRQDYLQLQISTLKKTNKLFSKNEMTDDFKVSIEYLHLSNKLHKINNIFTFDLSRALTNIKDLLVNDKDWIDGQIDQIAKILPEIDSDFERYVNEIKDILKIN